MALSDSSLLLFVCVYVYRRPAEALPYALEGLRLLEPWGLQFELALEDRTPHYPAQVRPAREGYACPSTTCP